MQAHSPGALKSVGATQKSTGRAKQSRNSTPKDGPQRGPTGNPQISAGRGPQTQSPTTPPMRSGGSTTRLGGDGQGWGPPKATGHPGSRAATLSRHCCSPELQTHGSRFLWDSATQDLWEHPTPLAPPKRLFSWSLPSRERVPLSFQALEPEAMELPLVPPCLALPARPS